MGIFLGVMLIQKDSTRYHLLELTALCGEFPADQLYRLIPSSSYAEKVITQLKSEKLLRVHYRDKLRGYRLTKRSKEYLLQEAPKRFALYLTGNADTNQIRSEKSRRLRLHLRAEGYLTLFHAGIPVFPDEKPDLFLPGYKAGIWNVRSYPLFYSAREIKRLGDDTTKIRNSRCMGIVLTSECVFAIYNTGNALMKWEYRTEIRVNAFLQQYLSGNPYPGIPKVRAIMLGRDMDMAYRLLTSTGGHKKAFFSLDTSYEHFHYVPNTPEGELLLKVLCSPIIKKKLNQLLRSDLLPPDRQLAIEHDALTSEKDVVLFAYDFDMLRINKFNTALKLFGRRGVLIAFDFQLPVLKAFLGEDLQYSSIDLLKFKRGFLHGP